MKSRGKGVFFGAVSGILYGCTPIIIVSVSRGGGATAPAILMLRYMITSVLLLPFALYSARIHREWKGRAGQVVVSGLLMSGTATALYVSYRWLPAGVGMAISYLYPLLVLWGKMLFRHKKAGRMVAAAEVLCMAGVLLLVNFDTSSISGGAWKGVVFALLSAILYSVFLIWNDEKKLGAIHPLVFTEIMTCTCAATVFLFNLLTGQYQTHLSGGDLLRVALVGIIGAAATGTQMVSIRCVGAVYTSVLATLELVICCAGSALVLHEQFGWKAAIGSSLMIAATILITLDSGNSKSHSNQSGSEKETGGKCHDV